MKSKYLSVLFLSLSLYSSAQEWQLIDTLIVNEKLTSYSIDNQNQIYLGTSSGNLHRFSQDGQESEFYSAIANFPVTSIAAWNRLKVFLFYRNPQEFYYLDRFNTFSNSYDLSEYSDELANECTPGIDNSLWILSSSFNELRKYNLQTKQLIFANPLSVDMENVTHMRAFQNLVIISDKEEGMYFFDQFGNLLTQIELAGIDHFQIQSGKVIFLCEEGVVTIDPFQPNSYETIKAPEGAFKGLLKSDTTYFLIRSGDVLVYRRF